MQLHLPLLLCPAGAAAALPNVAFLLVDDLGWADVGYHGGDFPTPNIDAVAKGGVRLENWYVQPICSPTRAALMTGRHPYRIGMQHFTTLLPGSTAHLPLDHPTLAEVFRARGYATAMLGKWHLGAASFNYTPTGRGFDSFMGYLQGQNDYFWGYTNASGVGANASASGAVGFDRWRNRTVDWASFGQYPAPSYQAEAERILDLHVATGTPFFLYWAVQEIHVPLQQPPAARYAAPCAALPDAPYAQRACGTAADDVCCAPNRRVLCAMTQVLDEHVGGLVAGLRSRGLWGSTLLWLSADNGGMTSYQHDFPASASSNWPLRAGKTTLFQGGIRVVGVVAGGVLPAAAAGSRASAGLAHIIDVYPTLARLIGADVPAAVDGVDLWAAITTGAAPPRGELCVNIDRTLIVPGLAALLQGEMKLIVGSDGGATVGGVPVGILPTGTGAYDGYWHSTPYQHAAAPQESGRHRLYNLTADPTESRDLSGEMPALAARMLARLEWYGRKENGYVPMQANAMCAAGDPCWPPLHNNTMSPWLD